MARREEHTVEIGVVGAGAWGTALAMAAMRAGKRVRLWARDPAHAEAIAASGANGRYLAGIGLHPLPPVTAELADLEGADALILAVPAQSLAEVSVRLPACEAIVIAAKGLESGSGRRLTEVVAAGRPEARLAVLSGPSFAVEVARDQPCALVLACADGALGRRLAEALTTPRFRLYWTDDVTGVEVGGALKNVLAIAAGIADGMDLGDNARAALVTRGLAELARLGAAMGARTETMMGLSGLGDLILTSTSGKSRNYRLGRSIGEQRGLGTSLSRPDALAEGVWTAQAALRVAGERGLDLPISRAVAAILAGEIGVDAAMEQLLLRPPRPEPEGHGRDGGRPQAG
ncbi:NAD(P)H-dependent glycerol-3-phosphate dehydrogenase [Marinivivus vitaminiproducens]|uniref:NAD(P)H-dependent glycerol-3-phosphate dehydrogenase n=1 Tax=Marinivivus vitaminiproducens TaxID=3035935 RepID=UPI0027A392E2|nr:NAD(P)-dependent glycerol-3-phosphate dehydrogenase [Geminicoccaceae bacterium SCSIO 64248]